ncbi:MAG TPA: peptide chain release factor N(5)-glutamine methyltransferase [Rhizomicrobium sp.]|nr:peptide chain release factor N(5)-glutamine methyltransferase [Rhizomicrobium sp.]
MTIAVRDALAEGAAQLRAAGIESARLDARVLLAAALQISPDMAFAGGELRPGEYEQFAALIARRAAREPLAYVTGHREFWSLSFAVGAGVLVPRPETETLVEAALARFGAGKPLRVLDIGTGSGCLLISVLLARPEATGVGIDLSESALAWARKNAIAAGVFPRCRLELADTKPAGGERFDVILANPPYLSASEFEASAPEIRLWEPPCALVGGEDGFDAIRSLAPLLGRMLARGGKAFVEVGIGQAIAAAEILAGSGLDVCDVVSDLSGIPRCLVAGRAGNGGC